MDGGSVSVRRQKMIQIFIGFEFCIRDRVCRDQSGTVLGRSCVGKIIKVVNDVGILFFQSYHLRSGIKCVEKAEFILYNVSVGLELSRNRKKDRI